MVMLVDAEHPGTVQTLAFPGLALSKLGTDASDRGLTRDSG